MANQDPQPRGRARKRFGQNFLRDPETVSRILAALDPGGGSPVLEIGPGRGALTLPCLEQVERMAAIEIDRDLAAEWRNRISDDRLLLIESDVLEVRFCDIAARLGTQKLRIVGNLPYNISKPFSMRMVEQADVVERGVFMYQQEVANRLTASPGEKAYGPLGILTGFMYDVSRLFDVPPGAFLPVPKVMSTVTLWTPRPDPADPETRGALRACLRAGFAHRRKKLQSNLSMAWGAARATRLLKDAAIDGNARAETIPPAGWLDLARLWIHA